MSLRPFLLPLTIRIMRMGALTQKLFFILLLCSPVLYAMNFEHARLSKIELTKRASELFETLSTRESLAGADQVFNAHLSTTPHTQDKQDILQYGLRLAVEQMRFDLAKLYILFGADQNLCSFDNKCTLLQSVSTAPGRGPSRWHQENAEEQVAFLLEYGANTNPQEKLEYSPLDHQLSWLDHNHNHYTPITYAVCKLLFAHETRMNQSDMLLHLAIAQIYEFECARQEQREKVKKQLQDMLIPRQDYYFLEKENKNSAPLFPVSYNPALLFNFQELRAQYVHKAVCDCALLPAPLAALITDYLTITDSNSETVPDLALLAVMIRKNQLLLASHEKSARQEREQRRSAHDPEDSGCGWHCMLQ